MSGMHPQFMTAKRFPVHAAIETLDLVTLADLLKKEANFHFGRKLANSEVTFQMTEPDTCDNAINLRHQN